MRLPAAEKPRRLESSVRDAEAIFWGMKKGQGGEAGWGCDGRVAGLEQFRTGAGEFSAGLICARQLLVSHLVLCVAAFLNLDLLFVSFEFSLSFYLWESGLHSLARQ